VLYASGGLRRSARRVIGARFAREKKESNLFFYLSRRRLRPRLPSLSSLLFSSTHPSLPSLRFLPLHSPNQTQAINGGLGVLFTLLFVFFRSRTWARKFYCEFVCFFSLLSFLGFFPSFSSSSTSTFSLTFLSLSLFNLSQPSLQPPKSTSPRSSWPRSPARNASALAPSAGSRSCSRQTERK